jgi:hypothetical protein
VLIHARSAESRFSHHLLNSTQLLESNSLREFAVDTLLRDPSGAKRASRSRTIACISIGDEWETTLILEFKSHGRHIVRLERFDGTDGSECMVHTFLTDANSADSRRSSVTTNFTILPTVAAPQTSFLKMSGIAPGSASRCTWTSGRGGFPVNNCSPKKVVRRSRKKRPFSCGRASPPTLYRTKTGRRRLAVVM